MSDPTIELLPSFHSCSTTIPQVSDDSGDVPDQTEGGQRGVAPKVRQCGSVALGRSTAEFGDSLSS